MSRYIIFFLLCSVAVFGQIEQNVEIEVVGRPSWQLLLPLKDENLFVFLKTDQTRAKVLMYDNQLQKKWEKEVFLDVERAPTAYHFYEKTATFLFRETSGMYYQLFKFDLDSGALTTLGFELREYFNDQDFVFVGDKIIMAGSNEKGGAFYMYDLKTERGKIVQTGLEGAVQLQELNMQADKLSSVWSVKTLGYANEKRKKGAFQKDAFVSIVDFDLEGSQTYRKDINQHSGQFAMTGKSILIGDKKMILGEYKSNLGERGIFAADLMNKPTYFPYSKLLEGKPSYTAEDINSLQKDYGFLLHEPIINTSGLVIGGEFYKSQLKNISEQVYDPSQQTNRDGSIFNRNTRTQTRKVFAGYSFPVGIILNVDPNIQLLNSYRIDLNQVSPEIRPTLSYNVNGSVAYCIKGSLAAQNYNIGSKPILYKLTDDVVETKNQAFLPQYQEVKHWYGNYFIAVGSKNKLEVINKGKTKKKSSPGFTQVRKTIYLTKISSGS